MLGQAEQRQACERLEETFLGKLDVLTQRQEGAMASCVYLEEQDLQETLAHVRERIRQQGSELANEHEQDLRTAAGLLSPDEITTWLGRFREACDVRVKSLESDIQLVSAVIDRRDAIEHAHAERAGLLGAAGLRQATPHKAGRDVALAVIHGMAVMAGGHNGTGMAAGLVGRMAATARALVMATTMERDNDLAITVPVSLADGKFSLHLATAMSGCRAAGNGSPDCTALDQVVAEDGKIICPLVYLVDVHEEGHHADCGPEPGRQAPADRARAYPAGTSAVARPAVGLIIRGPAAQVTGGRRVLDADVLASFARSAIFHKVYDGKPQAAAVALRIAQALEVVVLMDPGINGGVWADLNPATQAPAATLLIDGYADGQLRFLRSR